MLSLVADLVSVDTLVSELGTSKARLPLPPRVDCPFDRAGYRGLSAEGWRPLTEKSSGRTVAVESVE